MLIYDCEIVKAILGKGDVFADDIDYCKGWQDFEGMGISCIGAYDCFTERYRVFCKDNFSEFQALVDSHPTIVGFNSIGFDNKLCAANGLHVPDEKSYDVLVEMWLAAGLGPKFEYPTHVGFTLDATSKVNFGLMKSGHGALAPVQWQQGKIGSVIDYCLHDVWLTKKLLDQIIWDGGLKDPRDGNGWLSMNKPAGTN